MEKDSQFKWFSTFFEKFPIEYWGISGCVMVVFACLIPALLFRSEVGQRYSIHLFFISELGGIGISEAAWVFNIGLILAGIPLVIFMIGLAAQLKSRISFILGFGGVYAAINCSLVGIFPYNTHMAAHAFTAMSFFYTGMILVLIYSVIFLFSPQSPYPKWMGIFGLVVAGIFAGFLFLPLEGFMLTYDTFRREINWLALLEWLTLFGILGWICCLSFLHKREKTNG